MPPLLHGQAEAGRQRWSHREVREALRPAQEGPERLNDRRPALAAKLRGLLADNAGIADAAPQAVGPALTHSNGSRGWWLADEPADRTLGPALGWADREGLTELHVIADQPGVLARRAVELAPSPSIWRAEGRSLVRAEPAPWPEARSVPDGAQPLADMMRQAGLDVVVEHGTITGEVVGLEVARVVSGPDGPRLEVGVGRHDRDAFAMVHGDLPPEDALAAVTEEVRRHRRPGEPRHPLARLVPERWLRSWVVEHPETVGAETLQPVALAVERDSVKDVLPAAAAGERRDGTPVVVVCSVGVDLDLVPTAAETRRHVERSWPSGEAELVLVLPERDALPLTRRLAQRLTRPAEIVTVANDWRG